MSARAVSTLLPHGGTLDPSSASSLLGIGTGAIKVSIIVFTIFGILGLITLLVLILGRHPKSPPLPPVQPLAYHRERESKYLSQPYLLHNRSEKASWASLRMPSIGSMDSASSCSPSSTCHSASSFPTLPTTCATSPYPLSVESQSDECPSTIHLARLRSRPREDLSRKSSTTWTRTASTRVSMRSMNTIRGAPHRSSNDIEIVLPVPLAPQLQNHMTENLSAFQGNGWLERGRPISDRWMAALITTTFGVRDAPPKRLRRLGSGSQDDYDQLRESEPGRGSSRCFIRPQPPCQWGPTIPGNQPRPPRVTSQVSCDGQGIFLVRPPRRMIAEQPYLQPHSHARTVKIGLPIVQSSDVVGPSPDINCHRVIPQTFHPLGLRCARGTVVPLRGMNNHLHPYRQYRVSVGGFFPSWKSTTRADR